MPMLGHSIFPFLFIVDKKQLNALSFYFAAVEDRLRFETVSEQVSWRKKKKKKEKVEGQEGMCVSDEPVVGRLGNQVSIL